MKHLRKFENFSDLNMDFPDRLNSQCEKCGQELCNCEPECEPCGDDTNKNTKEDDWYYFDHPEDMPNDDNDGESYDDEDEDDEEEGDNYLKGKNWGDTNEIEIKRESNLITFKDFINEKKKGEVPEGLQKYLDKKSGKKAPAKKGGKEEEGMPDFPDVDKDGDKKEPIKKAYKEAKAKKK